MLASLYAAAGANENRGSNYPKRTGRRVAPINHPAIHFGDNLWLRRIRRWRTYSGEGVHSETR